MKVNEIMSRQVVTAGCDASVREVARLMADYDIGDVVIVSREGEPEGIITDRDVTVRCVAEGLDAAETPVSDCMTSEICYCFEDSTVEDAAALMSSRRIRRLPVMDRDEKQLVGIVSLGDLAVQSHESPVVGDTLKNISEAA